MHFSSLACKYANYLLVSFSVPHFARGSICKLLVLVLVLAAKYLYFYL